MVLNILFIAIPILAILFLMTKKIVKKSKWNEEDFWMILICFGGVIVYCMWINNG